MLCQGGRTWDRSLLAAISWWFHRCQNMSKWWLNGSFTVGTCWFNWFYYGNNKKNDIRCSRWFTSSKSFALGCPLVNSHSYVEAMAHFHDLSINTWIFSMMFHGYVELPNGTLKPFNATKNWWTCSKFRITTYFCHTTNKYCSLN